MNIPIVSASKEKESSFAAPVSSAVITRSEILNGGFTSIPEALRLAPGLIVREIANGSYDVSIRGGKDNLPSHQFSYSNNSLLVMINNRPIFNYLTGGTSWQSLPVDIADVERIEIVYGPNAPLYGPNAVDGVINIITQQSDAKNYGTATIKGGTGVMFSALAGGEINDKVNFNVSANYAKRKREKTEFYDFAINDFVTDLRDHSDPAYNIDPSISFPEPDLASQHTGMNFNLYYSPREKTMVTFNSGYNSSYDLSGSGQGTTTSQGIRTNMNHLLKVESGNFTLQSSVLHGKYGTQGNVSERFNNFMTVDNYVDYNVKVNDRLSVRPAFSYQSATIDDKEYTVDVGKSGLFNNKATMYNYALSVKADYNPVQQLRLIGAIRADRFKEPGDTYLSYQGIANYKLSEKTIFRFLGGRSYSGSFIMPTYMTLEVQMPFVNVFIVGNKDLALLQNNILELGFKSKVGNKVSLDVSVFRQSYRNYSAQLKRVRRELSMDPYQPMELEIQQKNIDLKSDQTGATVAATILLGDVALKPSITWQQNQLRNYSPYYSETHNFLYPEYNIDNKSDVKGNFTPEVFGGLSINAPLKKWNFNLSSYYYSAYVLNTANEADFQTGGTIDREIEHVDAKVLLNAVISYNITSRITFSLNGRNLLGDTSREAYGSDQLGRMFLGGLNLQW
jgi:iron complex outermembrane receptor protein